MKRIGLIFVFFITNGLIGQNTICSPVNLKKVDVLLKDYDTIHNKENSSFPCYIWPKQMEIKYQLEDYPAAFYEDSLYKTPKIQIQSWLFYTISRSPDDTLQFNPTYTKKKLILKEIVKSDSYLKAKPQECLIVF